MLVEKKGKKELVIEEYLQDQALIMKATRRIPVFVFKSLRLYQRNGLIKNNLAFVVPGSQIFIPTIMIKLEERDVVAKEYAEKFSKSTQVVYAYLLLNPETEINTRRLAEQLTDEQIKEARDADLFAYLQSYEPGVLKRDGANFRHREHDSLVYVSNRRFWYWNSRR